MSWFSWIILFLLFFLILLFTAALRIAFLFDSDKQDMNLTLLWLYPLLKVLITMEDTKPMLTVYLFNQKVYKNVLKSTKYKSKGIGFANLRNLKNVHVNAYYGFRDPFITGVVCGIMDILSQMVHVDSLQQVPDFIPLEDYVYVDATARVNVGRALVNLYRPGNTHS